MCALPFRRGVLASRRVLVAWNECVLGVVVVVVKYVGGCVQILINTKIT